MGVYINLAKTRYGKTGNPGLFDDTLLAAVAEARSAEDVLKLAALVKNEYFRDRIIREGLKTGKANDLDEVITLATNCTEKTDFLKQVFEIAKGPPRDELLLVYGIPKAENVDDVLRLVDAAKFDLGRDRILLAGRPKAESVDDILKLAGRSHSDETRAQILLAGIPLVRNRRDVGKLAGGTSSKILRAKLYAKGYAGLARGN